MKSYLSVPNHVREQQRIISWLHRTVLLSVKTIKNFKILFWNRDSRVTPHFLGKRIHSRPIPGLSMKFQVSQNAYDPYKQNGSQNSPVRYLSLTYSRIPKSNPNRKRQQPNNHSTDIYEWKERRDSPRRDSSIHLQFSTAVQKSDGTSRCRPEAGT